MDEREQAILMANRALDVPYADPDDDLGTISRQFLRAIERETASPQASAPSLEMACPHDMRAADCGICSAEASAPGGVTLAEIREQILDVLDELTPEDAGEAHPAAIAYQRVANILNAHLQPLLITDAEYRKMFHYQPQAEAGRPTAPVITSVEQLAREGLIEAGNALVAPAVPYFQNREEAENFLRAHTPAAPLPGEQESALALARDVLHRPVCDSAPILTKALAAAKRAGVEKGLKQGYEDGLEKAAVVVEIETVGGNKAPGSASRTLLAEAIRKWKFLSMGCGVVQQQANSASAARKEP